MEDYVRDHISPWTKSMTKKIEEGKALNKKTLLFWSIDY